LTKKILLFLIFFNNLLFADLYVDQLINDINADLELSIGKDRLVLWKNNIMLTIIADKPWMAINQSQKIVISPVKKVGDNYLFKDTAISIIKKVFKNEKTKKETEKTKIENNHSTLENKNKPYIKTIFLDPGHGGKDPGAHIKNLREKDINLKIGLLLLSDLKKIYPNLDIQISRTTDKYVSLSQRSELANKSILKDDNAHCIFISIHANSTEYNPNPLGFEVYYLDREYRRNVIELNENTNKNDDIQNILNSILEEDYSLDSIKLADSISKGMEKKIGNLSKNRGIKEKDFFVIRNSKMPAVLLEVGFMSNPKEARLLANNFYLKKISDGIVLGIKNFIDNF